MATKKKTSDFDAWLEDFGMTRLAKHLKLHRQTIHQWRRHKNWPSVESMKKIKRLTKGFITYEMMIDRTSENWNK